MKPSIKHTHTQRKMVFKGRFFSSKKSSSDTSSPDGSNNSPRSLGSNSSSPIRSDKKKGKLKDEQQVSPSQKQVKEDKNKSKGIKSMSSSSKIRSPASNESHSPTAVKPKKGTEAMTAVSPILASSLGLNRIKTRSGPLPQESFFGFGSSSGRDRDSSNNKATAIGASNLSKPRNEDLCSTSGSGTGRGGKGVLKKAGAAELRKKDSSSENVSFVGWADNGGATDIESESWKSREQSPHVQVRSRLQNAESSSSDAGTLPIGCEFDLLDLLVCVYIDVCIYVVLFC